MRRADLHTHTTASDGLHPPAEVVRMARDAGLSGVAITDHDTVAGLEEALAAGEKYGIRIIGGVEISTMAEGREIHVLGYGFDAGDPLFLERLASLREARNRRNDRMIERLNELGIPITLQEVHQAAAASPGKGGTIGRPHIAEVLVRKGYATDFRDAFDRYLKQGAAAYVQVQRISPAEAVQWIHEAGGTAIIAHPGLYGLDRLVQELLENGADGLEAFHSDHDDDAQRHYQAMAESRGKLVTGGSDFHGSMHGNLYHGPVGNRTVDVSVMDQLLAARPMRPRSSPAKGSSLSF
jgi:hypothetical protein